MSAPALLWQQFEVPAARCGIPRPKHHDDYNILLQCSMYMPCTVVHKRAAPPRERRAIRGHLILGRGVLSAASYRATMYKHRALYSLGTNGEGLTIMILLKSQNTATVSAGDLTYGYCTQ